jgi:hypothetical protein
MGPTLVSSTIVIAITTQTWFVTVFELVRLPLQMNYPFSLVPLNSPFRSLLSNHLSISPSSTATFIASELTVRNFSCSC